MEKEQDDEKDFHVVRVRKDAYNAYLAKLKADFDITPPTQSINTLVWQAANGLVKNTRQVEEMISALAKQLAAGILAELKAGGRKPAKTIRPDAVKLTVPKKDEKKRANE